MLKQLLESGARRRTPRQRLATAASLAAHTTFIVLAVQATGHPDTPVYVRERIDTVHFQPPPRDPVPPLRAVSREARPARPTTAIEMPTMPIVISTEIPAPRIGASMTPDAGEFAHPANDPSSLSGELSGGSPIYETNFVDEPIVPLRDNQPPRYPATLRSIGLPGEVVARFIVDTLGRTERESIVIVSSAHELFSASVRDALLRARFGPARVRGRPVRQLAEQRFMFKLER